MQQPDLLSEADLMITSYNCLFHLSFLIFIFEKIFNKNILKYSPSIDCGKFVLFCAGTLVGFKFTRLSVCDKGLVPEFLIT